MALHKFDIPYLLLEDAFSALADRLMTLLFDSADTGHPSAEHSTLLWDPVEVLNLKDHDDPFAELKKLRAHYPGYIMAGLLSYDLGRSLEEITPNNPPSDTPDICVGVYDQSLVFDIKKQNAAYFILSNDKDSAEDAYNATQNLLKNGYRKDHQTIDFKLENQKENFINAVQKTIDYIRAGDIFQANITERFEAEPPQNFDVRAAYLQLRKTNPAPFGGYLNADGLTLLSASPEQFLSCDAHGHVQTKPIKGTIQSSADPVEDKALQEQLSGSEKDRAENIMIVDLLRNDLSRNCKPHSINVPKLCQIESFAGLHHLVSTVEGQLAQGRDVFDLMRDAFPGGSITGAPKIRAMEIIEELESNRRGPYCGSLFKIDFDGNFDSNILIRTLILDKAAHNIHFNVGCGIVADSNPASEYEEALIKAQKIFEAFKDEP